MLRSSGADTEQGGHAAPPPPPPHHHHLDHFLENTTIHGLAHLRRGNWWHRLLWTVFTASCAGLLVRATYSLTHTALLERRASSAVRLVSPRSLPVPAVTVCDAGMFSRQKAEQLGVSPEMAWYVANTVGGVVTTLRAGRRSAPAVEEEYRRLLNRSGLGVKGLFDALSPECEELVMHCGNGPLLLLNGSECCRHILRPVYTMLGRCWTSYGLDLRQHFGGVHYGLWMRLTPLAEKKRAQIDGVGLFGGSVGTAGARVVVTNHYTPPTLLTAKGGVGAAAGQHVQLEVGKEEHDSTAERTPLLGGPPDCVSAPLEAPRGRAVPVTGADGCTLHAVRRLYERHCGCRHLGLDLLAPRQTLPPVWLRTASALGVARTRVTANTHSHVAKSNTSTAPGQSSMSNKTSPPALPICSPLQTLTCRGDLVVELIANISDGRLHCRSPCVADAIRVYVSQELRPHSDHAAVYVFYAQMSFTRFTSVVPGLLEWAQNLGGLAGLCLGMSLLSLGELVLALLECAGRLLKTVARKVQGVLDAVREEKVSARPVIRISPVPPSAYSQPPHTVTGAPF